MYQFENEYPTVISWKNQNNLLLGFFKEINLQHQYQYQILLTIQKKLYFKKRQKQITVRLKLFNKYIQVI